MRQQGEHGHLTLIAILVLTGLTVLGGSMGWMQVRSMDIASEWLNKPTFVRRSLAALVALGKRVAQDRFAEPCTLPPAADFRLELLEWGTVEGVFQPATATGIPLTITASQGNRSQQAACQAVCMVCYEWMTVEQCTAAGATGVYGSTIRITCP